jgi:hypothetical protein
VIFFKAPCSPRCRSTQLLNMPEWLKHEALLELREQMQEAQRRRKDKKKRKGRKKKGKQKGSRRSEGQAPAAQARMVLSL